MPRFSKIRKSIKDGLEGVDITAYKAYRRGDTKINAKNVNRGPSVRRILSPFFREDFTDFVGTKISGRAFAAMGTVGLTEAKLGLGEIPSPIPTGTLIRKLRRFSPAKVIVFLPEAGGTPTTPKSTITTLEYKKIPGESFTFPFGKRNVPGFRDWLEIMVSLENTLTSGTRASFTTENF
jgi:hypothetical protein